MLPDDMYNKYVRGEKPLFTHLYGSSWHGDDAKSVLWILHHPLFLAVLTLTGRGGSQAMEHYKVAEGLHDEQAFGDCICFSAPAESSTAHRKTAP